MEGYQTLDMVGVTTLLYTIKVSLVGLSLSIYIYIWTIMKFRRLSVEILNSGSTPLDSGLEFVVPVV